MADNLKETGVNQESKSSLLWNKLDLFSKIVVVIIGVVALLFIIALCMGSILSIIFSVFQVAGLIVALLLHKDRIKTNQKWVKYIALIISIVILALNVFTCFNNSERKEISHKVETPYSAEYCLGKNYKTVESDFFSMGFTNISFEPMEDLELSETDKFGVVELISINGIDSFDGNESFKSTAKIIIKYHSYKSAKVPFSTEEAKTLETNSIIESLEKVGFVNITTDEVYDLDPDVVKTDFENEVTIEEVASFEKNEKFPLDSEIKIVTHRPYEKYTLKISVDFIPNLMFSKYDVNLEINGQKEILQHGKDGEFEYRFKKGDYTLKFSSATDNSIKGSVDIKLTGDTNASYKIYCYNDEISVETIYVENKGAVGENEVMVPSSASNCMFENYKDIEKIFKDAGFTNITTEILYDIVWGWTEEGEVDSIFIDGNSDFIRGDIFAKDAKIVITYHMGVEDDPNKPTEVETTEVITETIESESPDLSHTVLPKNGSKLAEDFDFISSKGDCAYYINVDSRDNIPTLKKWKNTTVTDGVFEYIEYLEELGFNVKVESSVTKEPYAGFHTYDTTFIISNSRNSWKMTLMIQDEDYVEYALDIEIK